jgi:hypothetical protein
LHRLPTHPTKFHIANMHPDIDELLDLVASQLSIEEVLDTLDMEFRELLEALKDPINDNFNAFLKAVR